jgi:U3 small nucleolar RNA-associated protein 23
VITHCSIRHLHALPAADYPNKSRIIDTAKLCERRKCNHHELEEPLPEKGCIESVVLKNGENKHRYLIASQAKETRAMFREVPGVPLIIINRSVMILEPMNNASLQRRDRDEREKFLKGVVDPRVAEQVLKKRKREDDEDGEKEGEEGERAAAPEKKKKKKGPKGANPLSVKKRKPVEGKQRLKHPPGAGDGDVEGQAKKRRKRKHGKTTGGSQDALPTIEE